MAGSADAPHTASSGRAWHDLEPRRVGVPGGSRPRCSYLGNPELAGRVAYTWSALSYACHHHSSELPPTAAELGAWMEVAGDLHVMSQNDSSAAQNDSS
jgi:hypothetical protein